MTSPLSLSLPLARSRLKESVREDNLTDEGSLESAFQSRSQEDEWYEGERENARVKAGKLKSDRRSQVEKEQSKRRAHEEN